MGEQHNDHCRLWPREKRLREDAIRDAARELRKAEYAKQEKQREALRLHGARLIRGTTSGTVYDIEGDKAERRTAVDHRVTLHHIWDERLALTARQRATGQCYGAYSELAVTGGGSEFMKIKVDGGPSGGGGATERQFTIIRMVDIANRTLDAMPRLTYPLGTHRGPGARGPHRPISPRHIAEALCIAGWTLSAIALTSGWWVERGTKRTVPDRQRKELAEALRVLLDAVGDAWEARGETVPFEFGGVEVK